MSQARHKLGLSDAELGIDILIRRKGQHDYEVQGKKGRERSYPVVAAKKNLRTDDYGDAIRPEDYLRAEERDEVEGDNVQTSSSKKESTLGQKRRWDDVGANAKAGSQAQGHGSRKRRSSGDAFSQNDRLGGADLNGDVDMLVEDDESDDEPAPLNDGPQKAIFTEETLHFNLRIAHVDFCGLHDQRSLQLLIPLIKPRKMIVIGGAKSETEALAENCRRMLSAGGAGTESAAEVLTPNVGDTVEASVDTNAWMLRASKPFAKQIQWQIVRGLGVVALTGRMAAVDLTDADSSDSQLSSKKAKTSASGSQDTARKEATGDDVTATAPVIDNVPANLATGMRITGQPFLHVGDLRLAELRKLMQSAGFAAEFRGEGTLVINGQVAVRKGGTGKLEVEGIIELPTLGGPDPTFYDVRRKVYEGLAIVSGA